MMKPDSEARASERTAVNWNLGYVTEIDYVHNYTRELCPNLLRLACLSAGVAPPANRPISYLELGYGQGVSVNIHAAANEGEFWGTDFNPSQAAHARTMAQASGASAMLLDDSFAELAARPDLPEFDVIAMHGIWTWISDENGRVIIDLIRRKLRVGGLLYISYNCLPGWAPMMPLRHLMKLHEEFGGAGATGLLAKLDGALDFAKQVSDAGAIYFQSNPVVSERLSKLSEMSKVYLAHEYLNENWRVMPFSTVAKALGEAKLSFVCTAHLIDQVDAFTLTPEAQKLLAGVQNPILNQSLRDYFVNQQFRRDVFVKGPRKLTQLEQVELLRAESFTLLTPLEEIPDELTSSLGQVSLPESFHHALVEVLAEGQYAPKTLQQLASHAKLKSLPFAQIVQALVALSGAGYIHPAQSAGADVRTRCRALNTHLCNRARSSSDIPFLASPVTGGAVSIARFHQLFLMGMQQQNLKTEADLAGFVWTILSAQGQRLIKDGKTIEDADANRAELTSAAQHFLRKLLPLLKALGVA
jgi:SAM-dependent methyltransferase